MKDRLRLKLSAKRRNLRGKRVHLVFGFTGGGQEYFVDAFAVLTDAKAAATKEFGKGRTAYVATRKIR